MSRKKKYNFSSRPKSYWSLEAADTLVFANIKGEQRKRFIKSIAEEGNIEKLESFMLSDTLTDEERKAIGRIHPMFMGGEYLPDYKSNEVEIARISYASTMGDVVSIRAKFKKGMIKYRIVDDFELNPPLKYSFTPRQSKKPLSPGELIKFINSIKSDGNDECPGLIDDSRNFHVKEGTQPQDMIGFITVSSVFYPDLENYYKDQEKEWLIQQKERKHKECVEEEKKEMMHQIKI
ncbi:MAG: hypothetical protein COS99_08710 [Candidatus Omnitrophica bacterium CG07_land_8_20_14_0_80_42_15]|uniref:Uncharacterized protein n=1 Tax=Candidatus Aquitaenariimonas noxiae TaxID=1974741 RepID=A0A2J0KWJ0_9BACT|nr:MAG: hypothetical protein COS99_08710 [Candidatus Omnitrophica bacterium CG07_land_8_20_14_0_80_42_15]